MQLTVGAVCAAVAVGMVGASFAAVPLYRAFCQVTGWGGTTQRGESADGVERLDRNIKVRFDTNVRDLPWTFKSEVVSQAVQIGAPGLAYFRVRNDSDEPITGRAVFNVQPSAAGAYFVKTQCFCFDDQVIPAGTEMRFPVIFYVEPEFAEDRNTRLFEEVTLSYTYFRSPNDGATKTAALKPSSPLGGSAAAGL
jgi:cytochrome c oxidase assembly protein subunit 11